MKNLILLFLISLLAFSCSKENHIDTLTHHEQIQNELERFEQSKALISNQNKGPQYDCLSSSTTYNYSNYLSEGYYLNSLYIPAGSTSGDMQSLLSSTFANTGFNFGIAHSIDITFDIQGANGSTFLQTTAANDVYNEFICQLHEQAGYAITHQRSSSYDLQFMVDYLLCCDGTSCCLPILQATGTVYGSN